MDHHTTEIYKKEDCLEEGRKKGRWIQGGSRGNYWGRNPVVGVRLNPGSFFCRIDKWEVANLTLGNVKTYGFSTLPFHSSHKHWVGFERNGGSKRMVAPCFIALERWYTHNFVQELIKSLVVVYSNSGGQKLRSLSVTCQNICQVGIFQSGKFRDSSSCNDCRNWALVVWKMKMKIQVEKSLEGQSTRVLKEIQRQ